MHDDLARRVTRLERENRCWRLAGLVMLSILALLLLSGGTKRRRYPLVKARAVHVIDREGRVRARLTAKHGQPGLQLLDQKGVLRSVWCPNGWARFNSKGRATVSMGAINCLPAEATPGKRPPKD